MPRILRCFVPLFVLSSLLLTFVSATAESPNHSRCATSLFQEQKVEAAQTVLRPSEGGPTERAASKMMTPPPNPNVGDRWSWYIWRLNGMPEADLLPCTVRGEGDHCYVVVEDSQWGVNVNQAQVDTILARFEDHTPGPHPNLGIYDIDTLAFGMPPDELDNDPKVYILYYDFDVNADGFFWYFDEYPDGTFYFSSNECEVVYLNCSDNDPAGDYMLAVLAHEFEHMIHWNYDPDESAWVDEGCAELAMWLYGNPDNISGFNTSPQDPLIVWNGAWTDYIQTYLWTLYFYEQYGGLPAIRAVVEEPDSSVFGYNNVLSGLGAGVTFDDVFGDWVVANFVDDPSLADGRYGYVGDALPTFLSVTHSAYPVGPLSQNQQPTGCKYRKFINGFPMSVYFDGSDNAVWKPRVIYYSGGSAVAVGEIPLDGANSGDLYLADFGGAHDQVVVTMAHASYYGSNGYTYGTESTTDVDGAVPAALRLLPNVPNPFNPSTEISFLIDRPGSVNLTVHDASGRLVRTLHDGPAPAGLRSVVWDGTDDSGRAVGSGSYLARMTAGERVETRKISLVR
ncbi:MAG: FlgD immunoglobulin-like domain containing protein [Candidatus Eisenbacteria bacterium]